METEFMESLCFFCRGPKAAWARIGKDKLQNGGFGVGENNTSAFVMPSHYNCCVPLCTNHSIKNGKLSFYRIPKDESLRKKYTRLIRNKTLKLESSHTRICSAHFEGGKKK